nr:hypothetical protein [Megavirus caiporensis]
MNLINNTKDPIVTLKPLNGYMQTKYSTIESCSGLLELLDKNTNTITINHDYCFVDNLINYLRGNGNEKYLLKHAHNLKNLGIEIVKENYVFINIGGEIMYMSKIFLTTYFEYFEIFFENYAQYDPDYSEILIDKSSILFDQIICNLVSNRNNNVQYQKEISFYGLKERKKFFDLQNLKYYNSCKYVRNILYHENISKLQFENGEYIYDIYYEQETAIFLISDKSFNPNDIEIKNSTSKFRMCKKFGYYKMILSRPSGFVKTQRLKLIFPEYLSSTKILKLCHNNILDLQEKIPYCQEINLNDVTDNFIEFNFNDFINGKCLINNLVINTNINTKYVPYIELYNNNNKLFCSSSLKMIYTNTNNHPNYKIMGIKKMFFDENISMKIFITNIYSDDELSISFDCLYK